MGRRVSSAKVYTSVPWPNIGARVWVRATRTSVATYLEDQRLATHSRHGPTAPPLPHRDPRRAVIPDRQEGGLNHGVVR